MQYYIYNILYNSRDAQIAKVFITVSTVTIAVHNRQITNATDSTNVASTTTGLQAGVKVATAVKNDNATNSRCVDSSWLDPHQLLEHACSITGNHRQCVHSNASNFS